MTPTYLVQETPAFLGCGCLFGVMTPCYLVCMPPSDFWGAGASDFWGASASAFWGAGAFFFRYVPGESAPSRACGRAGVRVRGRVCAGACVRACGRLLVWARP